MRAMFSLVGLLVTVAIIAWVWSSYNGSVAKEGRKAQDQANSAVGNAPDGTPAINSVTLEPHEENGQLQSLLIKDVVAGGIMEQYYGLKSGDQVVEIGPLPVKEMATSLAMAQMQEAYMRKAELTVLRGGQRLTLPAGPAQSGGDSSAAELQRSLQRIPTH
jgi:hypothetical protein